ncbi:uncharacterized protein LOC120077257 [Benincasa hispida]|uniref:uncharacterized protein LOC120077257 n=1 Tax=Benincasa hispida TaxID=102211 RepID=UPI0018FF12B8|nr:uncharacterized protein LOC120077257 [Benincasa hispida]
MSKSLKIREVDRFLGQVTCLAHVANANKIGKQKLTGRQLEMFKKTVFGRFLDIELVFNSPLIHHMLLREVKKSGMDSISFFVRGKVVTFSKDDFLLITVYYTEVAMMGKNKQKNVVDRTLFDDVEDIDHYNNLDWGTIIWQRTLDAMKTALNDKTKVKEGLVMSDTEKEFRDTSIDRRVVRQAHSDIESLGSSNSSNSGSSSYNNSSEGGEGEQ